MSGHGFRVSGFGFRVLGIGFRVDGFGFRAHSLRVSTALVCGISSRSFCTRSCRSPAFGFRVQGVTFQIWGSRPNILESRIQSLEFRIQDSGLRAQSAPTPKCRPLKQRAAFRNQAQSGRGFRGYHQPSQVNLMQAIVSFWSYRTDIGNLHGFCSRCIDGWPTLRIDLLGDFSMRITPNWFSSGG